MLSDRVNCIDGGFQGFAHAGEQNRTSYHTNMPSSSTQSPVQRSGGAVQIGVYPNGHRGSLGQANQCPIEPSTYPRYTTQQDHPGRHNGQSYGQVGGSNVGHRLGFKGYQDESHAPPGNKKPFLPPTESHTNGTLNISSLHSCNLLNAVLENARLLYSSPLGVILQELGMPNNPTDVVQGGLRAIESWLKLPRLNAHAIFQILFLAQVVSLTLGHNSQNVQEKLWHDGQYLILQMPQIHNPDTLCCQINRLYGISETREQYRSTVRIPSSVEETFAFQTCMELFTHVQRSNAGISVEDRFRCCLKYKDAPALQFPDSEGAPAQSGQPVYEGRSADGAVPDKVQDMCGDILLLLSSPGWQNLAVSTPSSSPPQDARQSLAIRNGATPSQALSKRCPHCKQEFTGSSSKGNMSRHIRTKHGAPGSVAREYRCSIQVCGKKFRRNDAKLNHERKEHPELCRLSAVPRRPLN